MTGTVKFFDATKGWGFIIGPDGEETFVHATACVDNLGPNGPPPLRQGDTVEYRIAETERGTIARDVRVIEQGSRTL